MRPFKIKIKEWTQKAVMKHFKLWNFGALKGNEWENIYWLPLRWWEAVTPHEEHPYQPLCDWLQHRSQVILVTFVFSTPHCHSSLLDASCSLFVLLRDEIYWRLLAASHRSLVALQQPLNSIYYNVYVYDQVCLQAVRSCTSWWCCYASILSSLSVMVPIVTAQEALEALRSVLGSIYRLL